MKKSIKVTSIIFLLVAANVFTACGSKPNQALGLNITNVDKNISQDSTKLKVLQKVLMNQKMSWQEIIISIIYFMKIMNF